MYPQPRRLQHSRSTSDAADLLWFVDVFKLPAHPGSVGFERKRTMPCRVTGRSRPPAAPLPSTPASPEPAREMSENAASASRDVRKQGDVYSGLIEVDGAFREATGRRSPRGSVGVRVQALEFCAEESVQSLVSLRSSAVDCTFTCAAAQTLYSLVYAAISPSV